MLTEKQLESINSLRDFLNDNHDFDITRTFLDEIEKAIKEFDKVLIHIEPDPTRKEHKHIVAYTKAIRKLQRFGKEPNIKDIALLTNKNRQRVKELLIKHGIYDPINKTFKNYYDDWFKDSSEPDWEESFEGLKLLD